MSLCTNCRHRMDADLLCVQHDRHSPIGAGRIRQALSYGRCDEFKNVEAEIPEEKRVIEHMFKREERYVILKLKHMTKLQQDFLYDTILNIDGAYAYAKFQTNCVVVESNWKCYEQTWQAIQREFEGKDPAVPIKQSTIDEIVECLGLSSINVYILASNNLISTPEWDEEVRGIDKLIKELKDLK